VSGPRRRRHIKPRLSPRTSQLAKPWLWILTFVVSWLILITVLIALGKGGAPGGGGAP